MIPVVHPAKDGWSSENCRSSPSCPAADLPIPDGKPCTGRVEPAKRSGDVSICLFGTGYDPVANPVRVAKQRRRIPFPIYEKRWRSRQAWMDS